MTRLFNLKQLLLFLIALVCVQIAFAQTENIKLNQIGFYPEAPKIAVWTGDLQNDFVILAQNKKQVVFKGKLSEQRTNNISQKTTQIADFSAFKKPGKYYISISDKALSYSFEIKNDIYREAAKASLKGFYYQRASTSLPEKYAGKWHRSAGHPDDKILIHPSAVSKARPENTIISSPKGWYDAGDYNKYIVNSGITMATLFSLYQDHPDYFKTFKINIPESNNKIPDLLDESLWNLRWMLTMQDPDDGGVYHKLTNPSFDGMVMPAMATKPRYAVQKSITATLDFAAVMAQANRIFKSYEKQLPGLADSCLIAAKKAWEWAKANPNTLYLQNENNKQFDPDIVTGEYGDRNTQDEWIWAAIELWISTGDNGYSLPINLFPDKNLQLPTWNQVRMLGYYSLISSEKILTQRGKQALPALKKMIIHFADDLLAGVEQQAFNTVMGKTARDYMWGSSSHAANQGVALLQAYKITSDKKYLEGALGNLDYLLGRNAVGYSFLTGFGSKQVMHPHHRPSEADGIVDPIPGLLSGGPNPGQQDKCATYTSKIADESFTDDVCSYASNEIAINWNAPMVYLAAAIEALQKKF
ncbi:glycoside hydrolase family 9 protein [Emticicia sp. BO119]|uniref:glycoside hydrolase family 9 protein n=1 Tax=Emticicia sp. BO119 TaxID=2757768 RepID=UPI0015F01DB5|nr:glycoside hydrolase family 9 protein [Emticicia sp. BO119]MBA4849972.1 glycoside hydrolase family 9 protein [Emticicia sp. BO119]